MTLANVIFPFFALPWISALLMPFLGVSILVVETIAAYVIANRSNGLRVSLLVIGANIVSSLIGICLGQALPSGREELGFAAWTNYAILPTFVGAYFLSAFIEGWIFGLKISGGILQRPMRTSLIVNAWTYIPVTLFVLYSAIKK